MPRIWEATVEDHKDSVRLAIARATAKLVHHRGVTGLSMSAIADEAGISRATLYRYVKDTGEAVVLWRTDQIGRHLQQLQAVAASTAPEQRLTAVLERYALNRQHRHGGHHPGIPHDGAVLDDAKHAVAGLLGSLITAGATAGSVRTDIPVDELVSYAMAAMEAATRLADRESAQRLARLVEESLRAG